MSITWTKTAGDLTDDALRRVAMIGEGQTTTTHQWTVAKAHLNGFLHLLQTQGPSQWRRAEQTHSLVDGTAGHTLSPRPDRVEDVYFRDANNRDVWLRQWNLSDYKRIPNKNSKGIPTVYAIDRQRTSTTIYLWPTPNATAATGSLIVDYERVMEDVVVTTDYVDVPQEWLDMMIDLLGARMASSFRIENASVDEVRMRGAAALEALLNSDHEESIRFIMEDRR